jgi:hypothetical protein
VNVQSVHSGDIVECNIKGRRFFALATSDPQASPMGGFKTMTIRPITPSVSYRIVGSTQVIGHYRRSKQSARAREEAAL